MSTAAPLQDAAFRERAVHLPAADALLLADLHVGRARASDVSFPLGERGDLASRLETLLGTFEPEQVVLVGDVLHEFGDVSDYARETLRTLAEASRGAGARLRLVAGNHDPMLPTVWEGTVHDVLRLDGSVTVRHGHEDPRGNDDVEDGGEDGTDSDPELYVVGHDHPTITIEGQRRPCFLYGPDTYRGAGVLMLPAFSRLAAGVEVNGMRARDFDSPLIRDADALRPIVHDPEAEDTLWFPPLGEFRRML